MNPYYTSKKGIVLCLVFILSLNSYVSALHLDSTQTDDLFYEHLASKIINTSIVNNADTLTIHPDLPQPLSRNLRTYLLASNDHILKNSGGPNNHTLMLSAFISPDNSARVEKARVIRIFSGTLEVLLMKPDGTIEQQEMTRYSYQDSVTVDEFDQWQKDNKDTFMEITSVEKSGINAWSDVALPTLIITSIAVTIALLFTVRGS